MDKQISVVVISYNEKENLYVFNQTLRVLKDGIIKFDYSKKTVVLLNYIIRFASEYDYHRLCLSTLRAKEVGGRDFEQALDEYERRKTIDEICKELIGE